MKKIFFIVGLFSILFGQKDFVIPFDWAGQNGYIINNGKLKAASVAEPVLNKTQEIIGFLGI